MSGIRIDKTKYFSKPIDTNRLPKEMAVYHLLDKLNIDYVRMDHEAVNTIEDCPEIDENLGVEVCKNLFLCNTQKTKFYLLMMSSKKQFKTKDISTQIGSARLSFGNAEYMEKLLNITPGSVSILGLMNDKNHQVQLLIDKDLLDSEYIGCHPCINTSTLRFKTTDILDKFLVYIGHTPTVVELP